MARKASLMNVQTYWLIVAPGLLFGLSLVGWLALWVTRPGNVIQAGSSEQATAGPPLILLRHSFCTTVLCGERPQQGHRGRA